MNDKKSFFRFKSNEMGKVVCVTGASGYIASWLVKLLLHRGYTVKATVRNIRDSTKVEHLKSLEGAEERLQLFEANLVEQRSFDAVIDGCDGVFHTASPVILEHVNDPQVELIEPALKGTLNVLSSCLKAKTVKRVVLTSSVASVFLNRITLTENTVVDETWFSDPQLLEETKQWYSLSKTLAEEAARNFALENGLDLVVLNPGLVIGPLLQPTLNTTSDLFLSLISEAKNCPVSGKYLTVVDVRDVANAHVAAFEDPSANGRYCLVAKVLLSSDMHHRYPPKSPEENQTATSPFQVSSEKAKALGVNFISIEQSVKDTIESLQEKNLFSLKI